MSLKVFVLTGIMDQEVELKIKISWNLLVNTGIVKLRSQNKSLRKWKIFPRVVRDIIALSKGGIFCCLMKRRSK